MKRGDGGLSNLVLITQLGINVLTPVFLCIAAGIWIRKHFGVDLTLILLILGVLSGGLSAYRMAKQTIEKDKERQEKLKKEQEARWNSEFGGGEAIHRKERRDHE